MPIKSLGIILFREHPILKRQYLLIRRKDTVSFVVFLRGHYTVNMLHLLAQRMTVAERKKILENVNNFDQLWTDLWKHHPSRQYRDQTRFVRQKRVAKELFDKKDVWLPIFESTQSEYEEQEWGFPKGRGKKKEHPIKTAIREFTEETEYSSKDIELVSRKQFNEQYTASDGKKYQIIYYLAKLKRFANEPKPIDDDFRGSEISDVGWFCLSDVMKKIRPYHCEKIEIIKTVNRFLEKSPDLRC